MDRCEPRTQEVVFLPAKVRRTNPPMLAADLVARGQRSTRLLFQLFLDKPFGAGLGVEERQAGQAPGALRRMVRRRPATSSQRTHRWREADSNVSSAKPAIGSWR